MPCDLMLSTASSASVGDVDSILTTISLLPSALGRLKRLLESAASGLRTVAMTVVFGRLRYFLTKPAPRPCGG